MIYSLDDVDIKIVRADVYDQYGNWHGEEWNYEMDKLVDDFGYDYICGRDIWNDDGETKWGLSMKVMDREVRQ